MDSEGERTGAADREIGLAMADTLRSLPARTRTALFRLYILGEDENRVCARLGLTPAELGRVRKLARARFAELSASRQDG